MHQILIDDEVMATLKKKASELELMFQPPNITLRSLLGLKLPVEVGKVAQDGDWVENEIIIPNEENNFKYRRILVPEDKRYFFPGYKMEFDIVTDVGTFTARLVGPPKLEMNNPRGGNRIRGRLGRWFDKHPEIKVDDKFRFKAIGQGRYELSLVKQ